MPNTFAHIVFYGSPIVFMILFRRLPLAQAIVICLLASFLLLPSQVGFNLPMLPTINKATLPSLAVGLLAILAARHLEQQRRIGSRLAAGPPTGLPLVLPGLLPGTVWERILIAALVAGTMLTALTNGDRLVYGDRVLSALSYYDAFSMTLDFLMTILPFLIARKFLSHSDSHRVILTVVCVATLLYSLPTLWEVRMSPQLNWKIYGFRPADWGTNLRSGGFRPMVFVGHGLTVGIFFAVSILMTAALMRVSEKPRKYYLAGAILWLLVTLVFVKAVGALMITLLLLPVIIFFGVRIQLLSAAVIASMLLVYPVLRSTEILSTPRLSSALGAIVSTERSNSFNFRLHNEDILLAKAEERPLFGWGIWGRNRVFDERGYDLSITDGGWVLVLGTGGWVRYIGQFGLLAGPLILLAMRPKRYDVSLVTSGLAVALAGNLINVIPNSGLLPLTWLIAGALAGRLEVTATDQDKAVAEAAAAMAPATAGGMPYRRHFPAGAERERPETPLSRHIESRHRRGLPSRTDAGRRRTR